MMTSEDEVLDLRDLAVGDVIDCVGCCEIHPVRKLIKRDLENIDPASRFYHLDAKVVVCVHCGQQYRNHWTYFRIDQGTLPVNERIRVTREVCATLLAEIGRLDRETFSQIRGTL